LYTVKFPLEIYSIKAHFYSREFSAERKICKMWLADTNFF
jgi:hypothetical protein